MSKSRLHDLLRLAYVPRWTTVPANRPQSVAEHSYNVACITMELISRIPLSGTIQAERWALCHDGPENWTGDIPGNIKADFPEFRDMVHWIQDYYCPWYRSERLAPSDQERAVVKLADDLDAYMFIKEFATFPLEDGWRIHRMESIIRERVAGMTGLYGWTGLPAIVSEILDCPVFFLEPDAQPSGKL